MMRFFPGLVSVALLSAACSNDETPPLASSSQPTPDLDLPLVVYASMPGDRVQSVLDAYTAETGKRVQMHSADDQPGLEPGVASGSLPEADLFLMANLADLWQIAEQDGFRPTFNASIEGNIPTELRDPESRWTGLATSARLLVYNNELVSADQFRDIADYAGLGTEQWRGKLCLSSSSVSGNQTLVAFLIRKYGLREAEIIVRRWRANLASNIFDSDSALIDAIFSGQCATGIVGSNAFAAHKKAHAVSAVASHHFADASETVVEVSGGGVSRHAHNPEGAAELLVWLATAAPNALYAALGDEFPANTGSAVIPAIESWRGTVSKPAQVSGLAFLHDEAALLVLRAKYP
jgi:iron(III) transport system substrate-binding protein